MAVGSILGILGSVLGGVLGGAGSAIGGAQSAPAPIRPGDMIFTNYFAQNDPLVSALSLESLLGLGQFDMNQLQRGSPIDEVINTISQSGYFKKGNLKKVVSALQSLRSTGNLGVGSEMGKKVSQALAISGYGSTEELLTAQQTFEDQRAAYGKAVAPVSEQVLQGRIAALQGIANLAKDYPTATGSDITNLQNTLLASTRRDVNQQASDLQSQILQQANQGGYNPAGALGLLARSTSNQLQDAYTTSLERAIQLLSGKQTLANTAIAGLSGSMAPGTSAAQYMAGLRTGAAQSASSSAAQQNIAFQQLAAQNAALAAQAQGAGAAGVGASQANTSSMLGLIGMLGGFGQPGAASGFKWG